MVTVPMMHLPALIQDLGFILVVAAVATLLFKKLKQPVVLGYLLAGFLVGPHVPFIPTVTDTKSITIWAEIGVIFLLFGLGLEFSFRKLAEVGKSATITASFEILSMLGAGFVTGRFLGWSYMDSLFLGGILSISSTTIIVRAFDELGLKGRGFVSLVFGSLIVEDLIAILLLVLLASVSAAQGFSGGELVVSSLRLVFFMVVWFLLGIYLLPSLLNKVRPLLTGESTLIVSIGLCLMMVIIASHTGFSPALGAFVMGSLLAETKDGKRIEHLIVPVKDLFAAVFFVSVGMLIDPKVLYEYFWVVLLVTVVTIAGKLLSTTIGALLSGSSLKNSVQAGMSLAQIGEFSFIIATLGMTLKVTSDFLYPIAVAVSALTTFTTPYLIKYSGPFSAWLEKNMPAPIRESLQRYEAAMASGPGNNVLSLLWREYGVKILLNSVVVVAVSLGISRFLLPQIEDFNLLANNGQTARIACSILALILTGPFLWAIFLGRPAHTTEYQEETIERLRRLQLGVTIAKFLIGGALLGFVIGQFTSVIAFTGVITFVTAAIGAFLFSRYSSRLYDAVESRFISNLTEKEREVLAKQAMTPELAPWDAVLAEFVLAPSSNLIAKPLKDSELRERFGVSLAMIQRGENRIVAPSRDELLLPYDKLFLIGTDEQLAAAKSVIETMPVKPDSGDVEAYGLVSITLEQADKFVGHSIRESGLREAVRGLVVGLERAGERFLNPDPSMQLMAGDRLWIVGNRSYTKALRKKNS